MSEKFYHGDPNRDNNFWVYPRDKPVQNPDWDTYDASYLCNNWIVQNNLPFLLEYYVSYRSKKCIAVTLYLPYISLPTSSIIHEGKSILSYHGDFNRDNHFWVYPSYKPLHNPAWDTYDASELCNNYTNLGTSS
ncbi:unnamed protein product [Rotaria magnacalcarata]|uniref:Uncharacterized protein n=1 Tax=Rotaria magnacalcarata TaxID=392030 RepID=A0A8S2PEX0_9BILA|nr:unnamed protein product [Rotaria magnacalcarata]CAF4296521.1 unnamed protein product [Rotaria magnacalcarata]